MTCCFSSSPPPLPPGSTAVPTQIYAINVKDQGAVGDGATDDGAAFTAAITAAASNAYRAVYVPPGTYKINRTLTLTDVEMFGLGHPGRTTLYWPTNLGSGTYGIKLRSTTSELDSPMILRNLRLSGPQNQPTSTMMSAIQISNYSVDGSLRGKARFHEVHVGGFWYGFDCDTIDGHIFWDRCQINNNHDGIYFRTPGHDYHLDQCGLEGNTRAGLTSKFDCAIHRLSMMRCHIGQQPFGIYKEAGTTTAEFLSSARIYATSFEQIGNGVLYSDATSSGEGDKLQDVYLDISAFSWAPKVAPQYDSAYNRDAAIRCSQVTRGTVEIWQDLNPFTPGDTGSGLAIVKLSGTSTGSLIYNFRGSTSPTSTWALLNGTGNITKRNVVNCPDGERSNTLTVLSGQTSAVLSLQLNRYVCHIDAFRAHAQVKDADIGARQYWVTHAQNGNNVDVTVTLSSAAAADIDFNVFVLPVV